jgi:hypothetical protein
MKTILLIVIFLNGTIGAEWGAVNVASFKTASECTAAGKRFVANLDKIDEDHSQQRKFICVDASK